MLQKRVWRYSPNVVLLAFYPGNDVFDLGPPMQQYADANRLYLHGYPTAIPGYGHWNAIGWLAA
jgi:hypothetical protein